MLVIDETEFDEDVELVVVEGKLVSVADATVDVEVEDVAELNDPDEKVVYVPDKDDIELLGRTPHFDLRRGSAAVTAARPRSNMQEKDFMMMLLLMFHYL